MFESSPQPPLATAIKATDDALAAYASVDLDSESDRDRLDAAVELQRQIDRLTAQQLRVLDAIDRREAFTADGAITAASWLRERTRLSHADATTRVNAAQRLRHLPRLRDALASGDVTYQHVTAVTRAAVPQRIDALRSVEASLVALARDASPREVRIAVARVTDAVDRDGTDHCERFDAGPDPRRELTLLPSIDGLAEVRGTLDPLDAEALATLLDAYETPDPPDTPADRVRSAAQRRADAFSAMLKALLASHTTPAVNGYRAHILAVVDLLALLGLDTATTTSQITDEQIAAVAAVAGVDTATARRIAAAAVARTSSRSPRLRFTGPTDPATVHRLARSATVSALATMGPWRAVSVGRSMRTLPPWLRHALVAFHGHCRGPDCDRPIPWTDSHHTHAWSDGGATDLNTTIPLCRAHHQKVTLGEWTLTYDCDTGTCTWTGPDGRTIITHPPPP